MSATAERYEAFFKELRAIRGWQIASPEIGTSAIIPASIGVIRRLGEEGRAECPLVAVANRRRRLRGPSVKVLFLGQPKRAAVYLGIQRHWQIIADAADGHNLRGPGFARDKTRKRLLRACRLSQRRRP